MSLKIIANNPLRIPAHDENEAKAKMKVKALFLLRQNRPSKGNRTHGCPRM